MHCQQCNRSGHQDDLPACFIKALKQTVIQQGNCCWKVSDKPIGTATRPVGDIDSQQDTTNIRLYCTSHVCIFSACDI